MCEYYEARGVNYPVLLSLAVKYYEAVRSAASVCDAESSDASASEAGAASEGESEASAGEVAAVGAACEGDSEKDKARPSINELHRKELEEITQETWRDGLPEWLITLIWKVGQVEGVAP